MIRKIFLTLLCAASIQSASAEDRQVELLCRYETKAETRYSLDLIKKTLALTGTPIELPIEIHEKEIIHKTTHEDTLMSLIEIDRFTLKIKSYDPLKLSGKIWVHGQCEKLDRQL